jgi:hypothetical protein
MKVIGHQGIGQHLQAAGFLQPPHQVDEVLGFNRTRALGLKQESPVYHSRYTVVKALPLPFDSWLSH